MNSPRTGARSGRRIVGVAFVVLSFAFLGYFAVVNLGEIRAYDWSLRPAILTLSLAVLIAGLAWGVMVWQMLLRMIGLRVGYRRLARIWFISGLGRYIPGKIWQFVGAAHLGTGAGLSPAATVMTLAVHTGIFVIAAFVIGVFVLPVEAVIPGGGAFQSVRWLVPVVLLLLHPRIIRSGLAWIARITGREIARWDGRWIDGLMLVFVACIGWLITGFAFVLFVLSLTPIPPGSIASLIAMNALAFVAGYLVFFVPAGLGAKEGALAAMLTLYLPAPVAALIAIAARLWTIAAEAIPAVILLIAPLPAPPSVASGDNPGISGHPNR